MPEGTGKRLIIALLATIVAVLVHLLNAELSDLPGGLHETADDPSYLRPAENFADQGTWKDNTTGASSYVQRPPLTGIIHLVFYNAFGSRSLVAGMIFAFLLHGLAVYNFPGLVTRSGIDRWKYILTLMYALLPCFWGFLSYSITESITPSLIILALSVFTGESLYRTGLAILMIAFIWLLRPVLAIVFIVAIVYLLRKEKFRITILNLALAGTGILAVLSWEIRKAGYMDGWLELHPIYHETNETMFRPVHRDLSDLFRIWETKPEDFHAITGYYWSAKRNPNDPIAAAYYNNHSVPIPFSQFDALLCSYSLAENDVKERFGKGNLKETRSERNLSIRLKAITSATIANNRWQYYVKTPAKSAVETLTKSQLNLELFQTHYRDSIWVKCLKMLCVLVIISGFLCCFVLLIRGTGLPRLITLGTLLYLIYLFWFQRMNEERYLIPVLPVFLIAIGATIDMLGSKIKRHQT